MATPPGRVRMILALGVVSVSFPAILVRYAEAAPVAVAFWRKVLAAALLVPLAVWGLRRGEWRLADARALLLPMAGTGLLLAAHFTTWMTSVKTTTVASSLVLASTIPVWAALMGAWFLGDTVGRRGAAAIALSLAGCALLAAGDWGRGSESLLGDLLAVLAALFAAAYLTAGRAIRARLPLAPWLLGVYFFTAGWLGLWAALTQTPLWGFDRRTWWMFVLLALIPSTLGHNLLNYAVRHMETYKVGLASLAEPVVSTLLAAWLFAEIPGPLFYPGALLTMGGVGLALWPTRPLSELPTV